MFNTILVSLSVLALLAIGIFLGVFGRTIIKAIKEGLAERKVAQEVALDLPMMEKAGTYTTSDRKADVRWDGKGNLVSVGLRGGIPYDSFDEMFRVEKMDMKTFKELEEMARRFGQVQEHLEEETYKPDYRREFNTEKALGKKLYVYIPGELEISDRMIVFLNEVDGAMGITGAMYSADGLKNGDMICALDLVANGTHTVESANEHQDAWSDVLDDPEFAAEAKLVEELQDHLEFYNHVISEKKVRIVGNKIYYTTLPQSINKPAQTTATKTSPRNQVDQAIKNAQKFQSVSSK